jgi:hypothetical protein
MKFRNLTLDSGHWQFYVGKKNVVIKYPEPSNKKKVVSFGELGVVGSDLDTPFDNDVSITPSIIKDFIEKELVS